MSSSNTKVLSAVWMTRPLFIARHGHRADMLPQDSAHEHYLYPDSVPGILRATVPVSPIYNDPLLSPEGINQALDLGKHVALRCMEHGIRKVHLIVSPYLRTIQTATGIMLGVRDAGLDTSDICLEPGIREWIKVDDSMSRPPWSSPSEILRFLPLVKLDQSYKALWPYPTTENLGESIDSLHDRCSKVMDRMRQVVATLPAEETYILVSHAATKIAIVRAVLGREFSSVRNGLCSLSTLMDLQEQRAKGFLPVKVEHKKTYVGYRYECNFLRGGEQHPWCFSGEKLDTDRAWD